MLLEIYETQLSNIIRMNRICLTRTKCVINHFVDIKSILEKKSFDKSAVRARNDYI